MPFSVAASIDNLDQSARDLALVRLAQLQTEQRNIGMEPRDDSKLSYMFAKGEVDEQADVIAHELVAVDYIHQNTQYTALIEEVMREIALHCKKKYRLPWTEVWEVVRFYAPTMLKLYCMRESNAQIPNRR